MSVVRAAFVGLLTLLLIAIPATAMAKFTRGAAAAMPVSTDTLAAPTNLKVICHGNGQPLTITWTITSDLYGSGYVIYSSYGGDEESVTVPGRTVTSYQPTQSVPGGTVITMASYYRSWTSARAPTVTVPNNCK